MALAHLLDSVEIGRALSSRDVSLLDRRRLQLSRHAEHLPSHRLDGRGPQLPPTPRSPMTSACSSNTSPSSRPSITPISPTGACPSNSARSAGPKAKVLVDTGHHYQGTNIEQIVAWLLRLDALGGFHFNDRKYADDDLTLGSIDPYQVFRIFHEILTHLARRALRASLS